MAYEALWTAAEAEWIERLEADFANQQVAFHYWTDRGQLTEALTIAIALNQLGELALQRPACAEGATPPRDLAEDVLIRIDRDT